MIHVLPAALALVLLAANPPPPPADAPASDSAPATAPNAAVVGGHHIQPHAGDAGTGLSKRDADDVDQLYQELMRQTAPDATRAKGSGTPQ